jgi:hypothetical protein
MGPLRLLRGGFFYCAAAFFIYINEDSLTSTEKRLLLYVHISGPDIIQICLRLQNPILIILNILKKQELLFIVRYLLVTAYCSFLFYFCYFKVLKNWFFVRFLKR